MYLIRLWLSVCVTLNLQIFLFTVSSGKIGDVLSIEQSLFNSSDVQTSFSTDTLPGMGNKTSSVLHVSTIFHGETSSDDNLNPTTIAIMTATVNSELELSNNDIINTSSVTLLSNYSSPATINGTVENMSVNESTESSSLSTSYVHSSIYSTKMSEIVSTSFESFVVSPEIQLNIDSTISSYDNNIIWNASNPIVSTELPASSNSDSNISSYVSSHFSITTTGEYTLPTSAEYTLPTSAEYTLPTSAEYTLPTSAEYTLPTSVEYTLPTSAENNSSLEVRSVVHSQEPDLSASIRTSQILSEMFNTTATQNISDVMVALNTSMSSLLSVETTAMYPLNPTERAVLSTRTTTLSTDHLHEVIETPSDTFDISSFESLINNDSFTPSYEDTTDTVFSSPILSTSSFIVTPSLLDFNMTFSTSEEPSYIQSNLSADINIGAYVSTLVPSTGTQIMNVSDVSETWLSNSTSSFIDSNVLYVSTQLTEPDISSTRTEAHLTDSFLPNTVASVMESATESSVSTTFQQSSSSVPTGDLTSASSFLTSKQSTDGSHLSTVTSSDIMNTTSLIVNTSDEDFKNETGSKGDILTRVMITFDGNCRILRGNAQLQGEFLKAWTEDVRASTGLEIDTDVLRMEEMLCDPFRVILLLVANDSILLSSVRGEILSSSFNVRIPDSVRELNFSSTKVEILDVDKTVDGQDDIVVTSHLEVTDFVIIGVASLLFAVLVCMLCIAVCRECYIRQRSSSFSLSEIPHINLKLSDFTLTKIPRPQVFYRENSKRKPDRIPVTRIGQMSRHNGHVDKPCVEHHYDQLNINADKIQVRMRDHAHGLVVGVMCSKPTTGKAEESSVYGESKKSLLGEKKVVAHGGLSNPSFSATGEEVIGNTQLTVYEDEIEHFL